MKWCREPRWSPRVRPVCHGTFEVASRVPSTVSHFKTERGKADDGSSSALRCLRAGRPSCLKTKTVTWVFNVQALRVCAASTCHLELERRNKSNCTHAPFLHSRPPLPEAPAGWAPALAVRAELGPHRCGLCALHPGPSTLSRLSSPLSTEGGSLPRLCQATRQTREAAVPRQEGGGTGAVKEFSSESAFPSPICS